MSNKLISIAILIIFISCSKFSNSHSDYMKKPIVDNDSKIITNAQLIGEWSICTIITNNLPMKFNVCPTIEFDKNGKGRIRIPAQEYYFFKYDLQNDKLIFKFDDEEGQKLFNYESDFSYIKKEEKEFIYLELTSVKQNTKYILTGNK
jgi:hypothetical protein